MQRLVIILICLLIPGTSLGIDRCLDYIIEVRSAHIYYFGFGYPWWYGVGQLQTESGCRANITAFDHGAGLAQFMPATTIFINKLLGENLNPYNPEQACRMQAFFMRYLDRQNPCGKLWLSYMFYNSGVGTMKKEADRAMVIDYSVMKVFCKRKVLTLKSGQKLDLCNVGYDYPVKIHKYGQKYKQGIDERDFW